MKLLLPILLVLGFVATSQGSFFCDSCLKIVGFLQKEFKENGGVIEKNADKVCNIITLKLDILDTVCHNILDTQIFTIELLLQDGKNPKNICRNIKFC
uniref:Saposin B-type domain-containing protein n=1 Tax=Steinernema glaseri TaxID=37863 RepID=A0A1I8AVW0_9BILA